MKKIYYFRFLAVFILLLALGTNTRAQNTCNIAASMPSSPCFELQFQDNQDYWMQFTADTLAYFFSVGTPNGTPADVSDLYLYSGSCGNLQLQFHAAKDPVEGLSLFTGKLTANATYYLRVHQASPTANYLKLCVNKSTFKAWIPGQCPPPDACAGKKDLISNGGFTPTDLFPNDPSDQPYLNAFRNISNSGLVCGWECAWGSPNLQHNIALSPPLAYGDYTASIHSAMQDGVLVSEGFVQTFADLANRPRPNKEYTLTFKYIAHDSIRLYVYLTNQTFPQSSSMIGSQPIPTLTSYYPIINGDWYINSTNSLVTKTVCVSNLPTHYDRILFFVKYAGDTTHRFINFDDVSLVESSASVDITLPPSTLNYPCTGTSVLTAHPCPVLDGVTWNYHWNTGETTQSISVNVLETTAYTVTVHNSCGFDTVISVLVNPVPFEVPEIIGTNNTCGGFVQYSVGHYSDIPNHIWSYGIIYNNTYTSLGTLNGTNTFYIDWSTFPNGGMIVVDHIYPGTACRKYDTLRVFPCCDGTPYVFADDTIFNNVVIDQDVSFNGIVVIAPGVHVTINNSYMYMGANARIVLLSGAKLILNEDTITACNPLMWDGIYESDISSYVEMNMCLIRDAKNALVSSQGADYKIDRTTFDKNYIDMKVLRYTGIHTGTISGSTFDCSGTLLPQYPAVPNSDKTWRHIIVNSVGRLNIGNNLSGSTYLNTFRNGRMGIAIQNSGVNIVHNKFENFVEKPTLGEPNGYAIYARNLPKTITSIVPFLYIGESNASGSTTNSNIFSKCTYGVYAYNIHKFKIKNNVFSNAGLLPASYYRGIGILIDEVIPSASVIKNISYNIMSDLNIGISLNHLSNSLISNNTINNVIQGNGSHACGIYCIAGTANAISENTITNNSVADKTFGIKILSSNGVENCNQITRMQNGIYFSGGAMPSTVYKNTLTQNKYGIHLSNGASIGWQGSNAEAQGNLFMSNVSADIATSYGTDGDQSKFYYNGSQPYTIAIPPIPPYTALSYPVTLTSTANPCMLACATLPNFRTENANVLIDKISKEEISYAEFDPETKEITKYAAYLDLIKTDITDLSQDLKDFVDEKSLGDYGKLEQVNQYIEDGNLLAAIAKNNSISENEFTISLIKKVNGILLDATLDTVGFNYKFDDDQLGYLRDIASQCPFKYGKAVYMARSILRTIDTVLYRSDCEQEEINVHQRNMQMSKPQQVECKVYPNPARGELYVDLNTDAVVQVELYNYLGIKVYSEKATNRKHIINTSNIADGVYTIKLSIEGDLIFTDKVTIIK